MILSRSLRERYPFEGTAQDVLKPGVESAPMVQTGCAVCNGVKPAELAEDAVVVVHEEARDLPPSRGLVELLFDPVQGGVTGYGDMDERKSGAH